MGKKRAKEHYDFIKEQYCKEIDNSITNTTIHACESIEARIPQSQNNYSVSCEDKDNVAVLNFASYKKPGGLYFQEEESLLYFQLLKPLNLLTTHGMGVILYNYMVFKRVLS